MIDGVVCPACFSDLATDAGTWACASCGRAGTPVGDVVALYAEPEAERASIAAGATRYLRQAVDTVEGARRQLAGCPDLPRPRMERLVSGLQRNVEVLGTRWQAAGIALRQEPGPSGHDPGRLQSQTLRDWAWPGADGWEDENAQAAAQLRAHVDGDLGRVLVLGAGAGRLAYDLHGWGATSTVALDLSPFGLLVASALWSGAAIEQWEFPPVPRREEEVAVRWEVTAPPPAAGLVPLLADGLDPPFAAATFDTVVTPWFIDQIPRDLRRFMQVLRWLLVPAGRWLNLGPLIYPLATPVAARHGLREVQAIAEQAGFTLDRPTSERIAYLASPASTQGRIEVVHAFAARRDETAAGERPPPAWLSRLDLPIPRFVDPATVSHPAKRWVASALDGRRTARDISEELVRKQGVAPAGAAEGVRMTVEDLFMNRR